MRKSQIISLVVLLVLVTAVIWIGSFTGGGGSPDVTRSPRETAADATPEPTPEITMEEINELSVKIHKFTGNTDEFGDDIGKMKEYGAIFDGSELGGADNAVYLTFEIGYSGSEANNELTGILDALKETGVKATFFISSEYVEDDSCKAILKRILDEGHGFACRGSVQIDMVNQSIDGYTNVIENIRTRVCQLVGTDDINMNYFRPFGCKLSVRDVAISKRCGMNTVFWTVEYAQQNGLSGLKKSMTETLKAKGIYNIPIYATAGKADVLKDAIKAAQEKYEFTLLP